MSSSSLSSSSLGTSSLVSSSSSLTLTSSASASLAPTPTQSTTTPAAGAPKLHDQLIQSSALVWRVSLLIYALIAILVVLRIPHLIGLFGTSEEWKTGLFLRYVKPPPRSQRTGSTRRRATTKDVKRNDSSSSSHPKTHHAQAQAHHNPYTPPAHVPSTPPFLRPLLTLSRTRLPFLPSYSLAQFTILLFYFSLLLGATLYKSNPFTDATRAAWVAVSQVPLVFALAGKNNVVGMMLGYGYERLNYMHRFAGKMVVLGSNLHAIFYLYRWTSTGTFASSIAFPKNAWGLALLLGMDALYIFSTPFWRGNAYGVFKWSHVVGVGVVLPGIYMHQPSLWIYALASASIYALDRVLRLAKTRVTTGLLYPASYSSQPSGYSPYNDKSTYTHHPTRSTSKRLPPSSASASPLHTPHNTTPNSPSPLYTSNNNTIRLVVPSLNAGWRAGQHVRLRVLSFGGPMGWTGWTEVHPFTVASVGVRSSGSSSSSYGSYEGGSGVGGRGGGRGGNGGGNGGWEEEGESGGDGEGLVLLIKKAGDWTGALGRLAECHGGWGGPLPAQHRGLDGGKGYVDEKHRGGEEKQRGDAGKETRGEEKPKVVRRDLRRGASTGGGGSRREATKSSRHDTSSSRRPPPSHRQAHPSHPYPSQPKTKHDFNSRPKTDPESLLPLPLPIRIAIEGPYGGPGRTVFSSFSGALIVCGGSGISWGLSTLKDLVRKDGNREGRVGCVGVVWVVGDLSELGGGGCRGDYGRDGYGRDGGGVLGEIVKLVEETERNKREGRGRMSVRVSVGFTKAPGVGDVERFKGVLGGVTRRGGARRRRGSPSSPSSPDWGDGKGGNGDGNGDEYGGRGDGDRDEDEDEDETDTPIDLTHVDVSTRAIEVHPGVVVAPGRPKLGRSDYEPLPALRLRRGRAPTPLRYWAQCALSPMERRGWWKGTSVLSFRTGNLAPSVPSKFGLPSSRSTLLGRKASILELQFLGVPLNDSQPLWGLCAIGHWDPYLSMVGRLAVGGWGG